MPEPGFTITDLDAQRAGRCVLGILSDDSQVLMLVLSEAIHDEHSIGVLRLVIALSSYAAQLTTAINGDAAADRVALGLLRLGQKDTPPPAV